MENLRLATTGTEFDKYRWQLGQCKFKIKSQGGD